MKQWLFILSIGLLAACATSRAPQDMTLQTLAKGNFSGIQTPRQEVIRDQQSWEQFWAAHQAGRQPAESPPPVNFKEQMVIAVTMGQQRTGGYSIEVISLELQNDNLRATVRKTLPDPDAMLIQALSAPFHFVAASRSDLPIRFAETTARDEL
jgi:hypothetical protein